MSFYEFQSTYKDDDTCLFRLMHPPSRRVKSVYQLPDSFGSVPSVSASLNFQPRFLRRVEYPGLCGFRHIQ